MSKRIRQLITVAALLAIATSAAWAVPLTDAQLYYDPWAVPPAQYPVIDLSTTSISSTVTYAWPEADVQGVQVLPLLNPYTTEDPGGYPTGYVFSQSDYKYQPNVDYSVDLTAGVATASFGKSGIYHVRVDCIVNPDVVYSVRVDSGYLQGGADDGASVDIPGPTADLVVVSDPTGGDSTLDKAAENAKDDNGAGKVKRASDKDDAVAKIKAASEAAGKKIHVELVCHGAPGVLWLGDTQIGGAGGDMSVADFQTAIDDYVNNLSIYACDFASDAEGAAAMQTLADSLGVATGFTGWVSVHRSDWWGWLLGGSWDLQQGRKKSVVISLSAIISNIKKMISGLFTVLPGATVTASFPSTNTMYVEADNRACGIKVLTEQPVFIQTGTKVDVEGTVSTDANGERCVCASSLRPVGTGLINPMATTVRSLGGGPFGLQEGIQGATGLSNIGVLVRTSGEYTVMNPSTFLLSDGGGWVKCVLPPGVTIGPMFGHVAVTGISSCEKQGQTLSRVLRIRTQQDITPL